ncbi:MAG: hypothetical protein H6652_26975 [Ardenticatenaceae bacterium]|nr:hypothetical protein [Ardenticatenaceae bacterium]MCB8949062.1 hypothetical protein [Ardenticatenaceae bacterium]
MTPIIVLAVVVVLMLLLFLLTRSVQAGRTAVLRPLTSYQGLAGQIGRAIESGRQLHLTLGQGSLVGRANPTSVSATAVLDNLAKDGCANGTPPLVTVGEGTLLPLAQASLQHALAEAGRSGDFDLSLTQFVAHDTDPFAYSAGVAALLQQQRVASNIMVGRFGPELAIMAEAANRQQIDQVIGTDDPTALAVAVTVTDDVLIGEELFATSAYLEGKASQIASLQLQDILRWIVVLFILGTAVYQLV